MSIFFLINVFILGCAGSSAQASLQLQSARGCSPVAANGFLTAAASHYSSVSLQQPSLQRCLLSLRTSSRAPEHRLSRCGARAQMPCGMWDRPRPGTRPMSLALPGSFLATEPPGKHATSVPSPEVPYILQHTVPVPPLPKHHPTQATGRTPPSTERHTKKEL